MTVLHLRMNLNFVFKTKTPLDNSFVDIPCLPHLVYLMQFKLSTEGRSLMLHQFRVT